MDETHQTFDSLDNTEKPTEDWKTGGEAPTGAQKSYINTLAEGAGVDVEEPATKAEASDKIDELQHLARATTKDKDIVEGD